MACGDILIYFSIPNERRCPRRSLRQSIYGEENFIFKDQGGALLICNASRFGKVLTSILTQLQVFSTYYDIRFYLMIF